MIVEEEIDDERRRKGYFRWKMTQYVISGSGRWDNEMRPLLSDWDNVDLLLKAWVLKGS